LCDAADASRMVVSTTSLWDEFPDDSLREYDDAVVYGDRDGDVVLHEGPARVLPNGWVELPSGRLVSPDAAHHIDPRPGE